MDVASVSSIGGGAAAFLPLQTPQYSNYYSNNNNNNINNNHRENTYSYNPPPDVSVPAHHDWLEKCQMTANKIKKRHGDIYGVFDGSGSYGESRRGALFCRSGTWLELIDERIAERERTVTQIDTDMYTVRGSPIGNTRYGILEFISVAFGLVSIRGVETNRFLCMNATGALYSAILYHGGDPGTVRIRVLVAVFINYLQLPSRGFTNFTAECVFLEEMMENYYNLYSSCVHGSRKKPWYVALSKSGKPRLGNRSRKRNKASHFLVVHYDTHQSEPPDPLSLENLLLPSLLHKPPKNKAFNKAIGNIRKPAVKKKQPEQAIKDKRRKKKRRREQRLLREEQRRRQRKEQLEQLREKELQDQKRPQLSGAGLKKFQPSRTRPTISSGGDDLVAAVPISRPRRIQ